MYETKNRILMALAIKYRGNWDRIYDALTTSETIEDEYLEAVNKLKCQTVTMLDADYPSHLRNSFKPPFVLFYYGDIKIISSFYQNISVVGSRDCSEYGTKITDDIVGGLVKNGYTIISGLARGIDAIAHKAAIKNGGRTCAVLGNGIDRCYPTENKDLYNYMKENQLVISEYPGDTEPLPYQFPIRNRIVAALSRAVVITEAKEISGSLITANLAMGTNTEVMCVPYLAGEGSGCNRLIYMGVPLVESAQDIIDSFQEF